jgi:ABC-2 type transport system permease protein
VTRFLALLRKELAVLFGSPLAWLTLAAVGLVTALLFFDHLRIYNQILFLYATTTMGGFASDTLPTYVNLRDQVFLPVMETLALTLVGLVPLVTMRVFAEERARGTDELLATTRLTPNQIVAGKFLATWMMVALMMAISFLYPAASIVRAGLGVSHLLTVYVGLFALGLALASIGLACSAFTSSQLLAAISAYAIAFVLYDFRWLAPLVPEPLAEALDPLSLHVRFGAFAEGFIRSSDLAYFAGCALVSLALARFAWEQQRVRG